MNGKVVILARGGSKGIPSKNLKMLGGQPLLYYPITAGRKSCLKHAYVSTNDPIISNLAQAYGADVIDRPQRLSTDTSTDIECFQHALMSSKSLVDADFIVHLRATYPRITSEIVDEAVSVFTRNYSKIDSLKSVVRVQYTPYKMWKINSLDHLIPVIPENDKHASPRQLLPQVYWQNACIDIFKTSLLVEKGTLVGDSCYPFIMDDDHVDDIDSQEDFERLAKKMEPQR